MTTGGTFSPLGLRTSRSRWLALLLRPVFTQGGWAPASFCKPPREGQIREWYVSTSVEIVQHAATDEASLAEITPRSAIRGFLDSSAVGAPRMAGELWCRWPRADTY